MKNHHVSNRSKYLFALGLLAIGMGFAFKKVISDQTECSHTNQELTYLFKI